MTLASYNWEHVKYICQSYRKSVHLKCKQLPVQTLQPDVIIIRQLGFNVWFWFLWASDLC